MNALPSPAPAANDPSATVVQLHASRYVTIKLAAVLTGLTESAIENKIGKGVWLVDRQFVRRDGRVMIDMKGYERWCETGEP